MSIPKNIIKEDLTHAADKIIEEGIPSDAHSSTYDVFYKNKLLPPKLIVSYANKFRNGTTLNRNDFEGGLNTECFKLLEENGFKIYPKTNINPVLRMFIEQSKTGDLKTSKYPKKFKGLKLDISFGVGNLAKIPWISFLKDPNTTSKGIYPVYLLYKELNKLILAYGVSETNPPETSWDITNPKNISNFFQEENLGKPKRYGASYVYKVYEVRNLPSEETLDKDLSDLIEFYKNHPAPNQKTAITPNSFDIHSFKKELQISGLSFNSKLITRFISSLLTKPFVILTGLSGSGKTKLAQSFVNWICEDKNLYKIVPVGADWTNREHLLGYPNALQPEEYKKPESGVLDLIIQANDRTDLPHFIILDEMNLSHVERYFADFLSVMESNEEILLHSEDSVKNNVPSKLKIPSNLFVIGTVNIDETTNMFSPKVLDRANTIEFRISQDEMIYFLENVKEVNLEGLKGNGKEMAKSFLAMAASKSFRTQDIEKVKTALIKFFGELSKAGAEFGYRSATEILRLIHQLSILDPEMTTDQKIDIAINQKLLPKLHGSRRKLCPILETLGSFCVTGDINIIKDVFDNPNFEFEDNNVLYSLSLEKITRMYRGAIENGFASFAEA